MCLTIHFSAKFTWWSTTHVTCWSQLNSNHNYLTYIWQSSFIHGWQSCTPMMAAILPSRGDTDVVLGPPPVAKMWDLWAVTLFLVVIFRPHLCHHCYYRWHSINFMCRLSPSWVLLFLWQITGKVAKQYPIFYIHTAEQRLLFFIYFTRSTKTKQENNTNRNMDIGVYVSLWFLFLKHVLLLCGWVCVMQNLHAHTWFIYEGYLTESCR